MKSDAMSMTGFCFARSCVLKITVGNRLRHLVWAAAVFLLGSCSSDTSDDKDGDPLNGGGLPPEQQEFVDMRVVSFNIRVDNTADGANVWRNRRDAGVAMIGRERPTLLGLQEAQPHQITYLTEHCSDYAWYGLGRDTGKVPPATDSYAAEETMAVFWKTAELELLDKGTFWLSETPEKISRLADAGYNRTCTWGLFRHKESGLRFYLFNTHLDTEKAPRAEQVKVLVAQMKKINGKRLPAFLTGDFNANTTDACFSPLTAYMRDARVESPSTDNFPTWNNYGVSSGKMDHIFFLGDGCAAREFRTEWKLRSSLYF